MVSAAVSQEDLDCIRIVLALTDACALLQRCILTVQSIFRPSIDGRVLFQDICEESIAGS